MQPQAAYAAFCFGEQNKYNYFLRTIPGMNERMRRVDKSIKNELLPSIIWESIADKEKELYSLPTRLGGLSIPSFVEKAQNDFENSLHITAPLVALIVTQEESLPDDCNVKQRINSTKQNKEKILIEKGNQIESELELDMRQVVLQTKEKGASSWLTVIPLHEHGFALNKAEFRDALSIRYNKQLKGMPSICPCGQKFDLNHATNCKRGGFVIMRHNNVRDFEANFLKTMQNDVEPTLQEITNDKLPGNTNEEARPAIRARRVWRPGQNAFFDIVLTNVNANYQKHQTVENIFKKHEKEKKKSL